MSAPKLLMDTSSIAIMILHVSRLNAVKKRKKRLVELFKMKISALF